MMKRILPLSHLNSPTRRKLLIGVTMAVMALLGYLPNTSLCQGDEQRMVLRSEPRNLTDADIDRLVRDHNFFDTHRNPGGTFISHLVAEYYGSDQVVFDQASGLVWQQSGSPRYMDWNAAKTYIHQLNDERFAGFDQWRLPTVTELASLLRPDATGSGLHLDPVFDPHQAWCWSSDQRGEGFAYLVSFYHGMIDWKFECGLVFARAVASASDFQSQRHEATPMFVCRPSGTVYTNSVGMKFVLIPAGKFLMGSPEEEPGRSGDEGPQHPVSLTNAFYLGLTEVTQGQWRTIMDDNPSRFRGSDLPVENVSWDDCQEFLRRLNEREKTDRYRLPSEAEWEYACRAGSSTRFSFGEDVGSSATVDKLRYYFGDQGGELDSYAWYGNVSGNQTHPVAQKKPNAWGLYDMHGNVAEWCADWYGPYPNSDVTDPTGPPQGTLRVLRGGSYGFDSWSVRSARRDSRPPQSRSDHYGLRVALRAN
jgi:formylglycine-generating enzyme required for sulfatase activity